MSEQDAGYEMSGALGATIPRYGSVVFDVDSTLSAVEGIDWLAERRSAMVAMQVRVMTERAMNGSVPLEAVYAHRLDLIRPTRAEIAELARVYVERAQPGARALCARLHLAGCDVVMLSGGLRDALLPLAEHLGVHVHDVYAVDIDYDADGTYRSLRGEQPLTAQQGKPAVVHGLLETLERPTVMVGDGSTDAATRGVVDAFIAYTGVTRRENVVAVADAEAVSFAALDRLLFKPHTEIR